MQERNDMATAERNLVKTPATGEPTPLRPGALVPQSRMRLGEILVASGHMTMAQVEKVIEAQASTDRRFGEIAIRMGFAKREQVDQALGLQFGYSSNETEARVPAGLTVVAKPASPFSEALRGLRSQLALRWFDGTAEQCTLAITSVDRGDGKSFVTANLGVVFSQLGQRTLVIDADLRHSTQHTLFALPNRMGLSGILSGRAGFEEILEVQRVSNLSVLPAGPLPPNPLELLGRETFPMLLNELSTRFDVILIDTPSAQQASDAQIIAERAKAALVVARKDTTKSSELGQLAAILSSTGVTLLGTMLNEY
jgi:receptor protein-tyrosine kinase